MSISCVAGLVERHLAAQDRGDVQVDVLGHRGEVLGFPLSLMTGSIGLPMTLPWPVGNR